MSLKIAYRNFLYLFFHSLFCDLMLILSHLSLKCAGVTKSYTKLYRGRNEKFVVELFYEKVYSGLVLRFVMKQY